jgi:transglutaminase-like putative cysteine protease
MRRLLRALRPDMGWPTFIAVSAAAVCLPLAIHAGEWVDGSAVLVLLGLAGAVVGGWLAARPLKDRRLWALGLVAGGITTFAVIGQILPSPALLVQTYRSVEVLPAGSGTISELVRTAEVGLRVLEVYGREVALRSLVFGSQIARWVQAALGGGVSRDNDIFLLWTGWLSWAVAFHAVAAFARKRHPGLALAPLGLAVTVATAADRGGDGWLYGFMALGTVLWAHGTYLQWERHWGRTHTDYSPEIGLDVLLAGTLLAALIVTTAFTAAWGLPWAGTVLRRPLAGPTQRVSTTLNRLFAGVHRPTVEAGRWQRANFADLPLTRVLAGPPELRDDPVLRITVAAPEEAGVSPMYWRGLTYDEYTGRGWANSAGETIRRPPQPGQVAYLGPELTQHVKLLANVGPMRYAAAQPIRVNVGATWVTRGGGDLVGWYADATEYTAISRPTMASVDELRAASSDYPDWVVERYLQLPADLPNRVRRRAREIVGDATTAYDKAAAIEAAMRAVAYSLEVGPPPADRDVVDHFLFDMDAGYCDYFATTMTVLARAVGVPARLATGYATGTYDPELGFYVVTGLDAHAWVEVYFPGIGWVPFEPTPARATIDRSPAPPLVPVGDGRAFGPRVGPIGLGQPAVALVILAIAGGLGLWAVQRGRAGQLTPDDRVRLAYDAIWQRAGWFGWDGQISQTPWERVEALQDALAGRSLEVTLGGRRLIWHGAAAVDDLAQLGRLFVKAQYSRHGVSPEESQAARKAWQRLRWHLFLLWRRA